MRFLSHAARLPAAALPVRVAFLLIRLPFLRSVFANLTNAYCLVAIGASENFNSVFEAELADHIPVGWPAHGLCASCAAAEGRTAGGSGTQLPPVPPPLRQVVKTHIAGTRLVGRMTVGNKNGLLLPNGTTDQELLHIRNSLPEEVVVQRIDERLSALGAEPPIASAWLRGACLKPATIVVSRNLAPAHLGRPCCFPRRLAPMRAL